MRLHSISALLLPFIAVFCAPAAVSAGNGTPARIVDMIGQFPCDVPDNGTFSCPELSRNLSFYSTGNDGTVIQLGVRLFSDKLKQTSDKIVCECIERLWAELVLRKTVNSQSSMLKERGVRMVLDGFPFGSAQFNGLDKAWGVISSMSHFDMTLGENPIAVTIKNDRDNTLKIYLPADRDLLFPFDKKEHEEWQLDRLANSNDVYSAVEISQNAEKMENGLWIAQGQRYLIDSLRNDIFLIKDVTGFVPVFGSEHPIESVQNMFLCALPENYLKGKSLNVSFRLYDRSKPVSRKISMARFLAYMQQQGLEFYCSPFDVNEKSFKVLLLMYHPVYKYMHMLTVEIADADALFDKTPAEMECRLTSFIPQHNIKSLFLENEKQ